jgi:hypothetical protein
MKYESDEEQLVNIGKLYPLKKDAKSKMKKSLPIPIIELLDISIAHVENLNDEVPIQYIASETAKKVNKSTLYDFS